MTYARFAVLLAGFTAFAALIALLFHYFLELDFAVGFTVTTFVVLLLLSVAIFWLGKRTAGAENKFLFGNVFLGVTVVKMFACGALVAAYIFLFEQPSRLFVLPFFTTYLVFTLLEIICLVQLAAEAKEVSPSEP